MNSVVVLTRDFSYWGERPLRDALRLIVKGKVEIVAADESKLIHTGISRDGAVFKLHAPLVIRLLDFVGFKVKTEEIAYSKEAVFERDGNVCQYYHVNDMGKRFRYKTTVSDRTLDHVIPKVKGGATRDFRNSVCCCRRHNEIIKRGRTPKEAGLELIRIPVVPRRKKGDWVVMKFTFNGDNPAHLALKEKVNI